MKSRVGIVSSIIVVAFVAAVAIASLATRSTETVGAPGNDSITDEPRVAAVGAGDGELGAAEAFEALNRRLEDLQQDAMKARSNDTRMEIFEDMSMMLAEFIDSYPGTPEAYNAMFDAGLLSYTLQKPDNAIRLLETFLQNSGDATRPKRAYAHYYLAESYKQVGKFEDAEAEYKTVLNQYGDVDRRLSQGVQQSLAMLDSDRKLRIGAEPIHFEVTSLDGQKLSPDKYKGKVLLLDFWATWCGPCIQEMPNVIKIYNKYNKQGFEIVGISLDRSRTALNGYLAKQKITWPQYFDGKFWQNEVAAQYGITAIPATFLIDKSGKIRYKSLRGGQLEAAVKELLAE